VKLLDLYCGAGGASEGYARAGFDVVGVDIEPHDDYPHTFVQGDALAIMRTSFVRGFDVIAASPPCPAYSTITHDGKLVADYLAPTRRALQRWGGPYVIENVPNAPLISPVLLCGGAFGLGATCRDGVFRPLKRHRLFETNLPLMSAGCLCDKRQPIGVYGGSGGNIMRRTGGSGTRGYQSYLEEAREALGVHWIRRRQDVIDAIPPAYTHYLGDQIRDLLTDGIAL